MDESKKPRKPGNLMERLRSNRMNDQENLIQPIDSFKKIYFEQNQLGWLEEYPNCWIDIIALQKGEGFRLIDPMEQIQIKDILHFIGEHHDQNIWRSWEVWNDRERKSRVGLIPFWLDIDDTHENLVKSQIIARSCIDLLIENPEWAGDMEHLRIGFSGRKGFHIYLKPVAPLEGFAVRDELINKVQNKLHLERSANMFFESTVIDVMHYEIRLMGSVHSWKNNNGEIVSRRTFEMDVKEFFEMSIEEILQRSVT